MSEVVEMPMTSRDGDYKNVRGNLPACFTGSMSLRS